MRPAILILLLSVPGFAQEAKSDPAEKDFEAMRRKLASAKSLAVKLEFESPEVKSSGRLVLAAGNKARSEWRDAKGFARDFVADGARGVEIIGGKATKPVEVPGNLQAGTLDCLARLDHFTAFNVGIGIGWILDKADLSAKVKLSAFKSLPDEKLGDRVARKLEYTRAVEYIEGVDPQDDRVTLWIDKETGLPLRREWKGSRESYLELKLDGEIDPATFQLPGK